MRMFFTLLFSTMIFESGLAANSFENEKTRVNQIQLDQIADACQKQTKKDQICEAMIQLREIGTDTIEAIKHFANLTPTQYAILTAANSIANGRLRLRTQAQFWGKGSDTLDIQKQTVTYIFERDF